MISIFYDLETSDRHRIAQILTFSFIAVDKDFRIVDEFSERIKISRLQLPSPQAVLVNRIDVQEHQRIAEMSEKEAMRKVALFIAQQIERRPEKVNFIGFNSSRFDLPFLRTSLIRNGIDPYFKGRLVYRDILFGAKKLSVERGNFPRLSALKREQEPRLSLSLETLCNAFDLLRGAQAHSARDDVLLSIELSKLLKERFGLDVRVYDAYEARSLQGRARSGDVYRCRVPQYDLGQNAERVEVPVTLLDCDHRYALWIDLDRYRNGEGRGSIRWYSYSNHPFFCDCVRDECGELQELAAKALREFSKVTLKNFFSVSDCDIEQDIYRLDISLIDVLARAIWKGDRSALEKINNRDLRVVLLRHDIANYQWGSGQDEAVERLLKQYSLYRYGGQIKLTKGPTEQDEAQSSGYLHATFKEMLGEIEATLAAEAGQEDKGLLTSLREFYLTSDIYRVAGAELTV
ncbi:MAG: hypothetical protein J5J00_14100 [Deltaproteobacteria bacterium]|nr:hypothetical protein [Deltaproteobacteria bacterium]